MPKNGGVGHSQKSKFIIYQKSQLQKKKSNLLYLPNQESIIEFSYIFGITTLENGGVGQLKCLK